MPRKVQLPAIGLIVVGALGLVLQTIGLFMEPLTPEQLVEGGMSPEMAGRLAELMQHDGPLFIALTALFLGSGAFVVWAGLRMHGGTSWAAAVAASFLVMVPCVSNCCCLVGIPVGIWSLIVLFSDDVRRAFAGTPTGEPGPETW